MSTYICPQCGDAFDSVTSFRQHYLRTHPDEPYPDLSDEAARADDGGRSYGGSDPTDSDSPINVFQDVMEQSPEDEEARAESE